MNSLNSKIFGSRSALRRAAGLAASAALLGLAGRAVADEPYTMAPPVESSSNNSGYYRLGLRQFGLW